jgi:fatty-acyl-CoA synthase
VIGVKDERLGEQVCACIKLKDGQTSSVEEIRDFCKGQVGGILMTGVWPFTSKLNGI